MTDIETLQAHLAISKVKARYCRMLDTKDWAGLAALFTEDFVMDVSEGTSMPVIRGREAALQQVQSSIGTARTAHQVHSPEIELREDEAHVIWAMQDRVVWESPRRGLASLTGYGHYHERYVKQNGEWKIAALRLTRLHIDAHPAPSA
jgi:hypothetical protein